MLHALDILLIIGILANIIKGGDLILRPHQQRIIQNKFDSLALWLDYTKPLEWYARKQRAGKTVHILTLLVFSLLLWSIYFGIPTPGIFIFALMAIMPLIMIVRVLRSSETPDNDYTKRVDEQDLPFVHRQFAKLYNLIIPPLHLWLFASRTFSDFVLRPLGFFGATILLAIGMMAIIVAVYFPWYWIVNYSKEVLGHDGSAAIFLLPSIILWVTIFFGIMISFMLLLEGAGCLILFLISMLFLIADILLKIIRGFVWRIAEYNKGAFAAIILIITVTLGIIDFYLKFKTPSSPTPTAFLQAPTPTPYPPQPSITP